jgi:transcriptional regulator with XRE-family HTH domain
VTPHDTPLTPPHPHDTPLQRVGLLLRQSRQQQGLSHRALAARTGISYAYISQIELGKRNISVLTLLRLTQGLGLPAAWLLTEGAPHAPRTPPRGDKPLPPRTPRDAEDTQDVTASSHAGEPARLLTRLGARIRQARQQHHLSQQALAASTGLSPTYILEIEQGHRNLSVLSVVRIAEALELAVADLLAPLDRGQRPSPPLPE